VHGSRELVRLFDVVQGFCGESNNTTGSLLEGAAGGEDVHRGCLDGFQSPVERLQDGCRGDVGRLAECAHNFGAIAADERKVASCK